LLAKLIFDDIFVLLDAITIRHRDCFGHRWLLAVLQHFERGLFPLDQFAGVLAQFGARFVIEIKHVTAAVDF
jgi:hypothetical protein